MGNKNILSVADSIITNYDLDMKINDKYELKICDKVTLICSTLLF